jgi:hypothetical protein
MAEAARRRASDGQAVAYLRQECASGHGISLASEIVGAEKLQHRVDFPFHLDLI